MLTRAGFGLLSASVLLLLGGIPTGNLLIVTLALLPLSFLLLSGVGGAPRRVEAKVTLPERPLRVGDVVPVTIDYVVHGGQGLLELHQPIPPIFTLESGNNIHLVSKRPGRSGGRLSFSMRCTRRGHFELAPLEWELVPVLGLFDSHTGIAGEAFAFDVRPSLVPLRRVARLRGKATQYFPENDEAKLGVQTTEFRDIREYVRGDPPKTINWKATARMQGRRAAMRPSATNGTPSGQHPPPDAVKPLVNEYEHEGKKTVWIFLDCGPYMRVGTSAHNAFEAALAAAAGAAHHFTDRGYRVGFTLFNTPEPVHLYPDSGSRRLLSIQRVLSNADTTNVTGGFPRALEQAKRFLLQGRSLVLVVTRADLADATLHAGLRRLRRLAGGRRRRRAPVLVASPDPFGLLPDLHEGTVAARLVQRHTQQENLRAVRRIGITLLNWDPRTTRFEELLLRRSDLR